MTDICIHKDCLDCSILYKCTKDENEYDEEKANERRNSRYCPGCGFILMLATKGYGFCIECGYKTSDTQKVNVGASAHAGRPKFPRGNSWRISVMTDIGPTGSSDEFR